MVSIEKETLKSVNLKSFHTIDETDFSGNIHGMKYHFLQELQSRVLIPADKTIDFGYWGKMKPSEKNEREKTIRQIYRDKDISTMLVGGFPSGVQRQSKWVKDWKKLFFMIEPSRSTLCFNWKDPTATTSRYPEALSVGIVPFVWKDYDINNTYLIDDFQRVNSFEELKEKVLTLRKNCGTLVEEYRNNYKKVLLSEEEYLKLFSEKMNFALDLS